MSQSLSENEREKPAGQIAALESINFGQLKSRWLALYETQAPARFSRDPLIAGVAYRMQVRALGGKFWSR